MGVDELKGKRMKKGHVKHAFRKFLAITMVAIVLLQLLPNDVLRRATKNELVKAVTLLNPRTSSDGVATWDCVWFGEYYQDDAMGEVKEPIKWRVLSVEGNGALLLADKNLDAKPYNVVRTGVTWETCTLRSWLNAYGGSDNAQGMEYSVGGASFLDTAFGEEERNAILDSTLVNVDSEEYGTEGGKKRFSKYSKTVKAFAPRKNK